MIPIRTPLRLAVAALSAAPLALCWPTALAAQAMIQSLEPNDADRLATQMRALAVNPQNLATLCTAGELSLKLGDLSGAAALFARADKVDPRNGRVKAGMAAILVRSERPGEALRFFDQAAGYGWPVERFAADRGLAYDLIGQSDRAQRDYRVALQRGRDDETVRRYALSLGIAGKRAEALAQLDPLVRRQDRAGWRAQAFVLAMNGDAPGAAKIATAMMPAAMNQGLGAFFQRLPTLSPTDRAFAVHFGEIYATPERLADARLTPALAPLAPERTGPAPVQIATTATQPDRRNRRERDRDRRGGTEIAAATAPVVQMAPPRAVVQVLPGRTALPAPTRSVAVAQSVPVQSVSAVTPSQAMRETDVRVAATSSIPVTAPVRQTLPVAVAAAPPAVSIATIPSVQPVPRQSATAILPMLPVNGTATVAPIAVAGTTPISPTTSESISSSPTQVAAAPVAPVPSSSSTNRADAVLARIVASLSIPASELGIEPARPDPAPVAVPAVVERAAASQAGRRVVAEAAAKEARDGAVRRVVAARLTGNAEADEPAAPRSRTRSGRRTAAAPVELAAIDTPTGSRTGRRGAAPTPVEPADATPRTRRGRALAAAADEVPEPRTRTRNSRTIAAAVEDAPEPRGTRRGTRTADEPALDPKAKRAADKKALADRKATADKKALAEQAAIDRKAARANPSRIWVQVAGGANEGDLGKAWSGVKTKTPALAGKTGYATPLRATNRVLTGPFKTDAEARSFVNQLKKQGVAGFAFTSDAGQEVTKLGGK